MPLPITARRDGGETLAWRRTILARAPVTETLSPAHVARLLTGASLVTLKGGTTLFATGSLPHKIHLIGSGFVQLRLCADGPAETGEAALHLRLLGPGDLVADRELACLAAGTTSMAPRRLAAFVLGDPAEILAIDQSALAAVLSEDQAARGRVAQELTRLLDAMERLAGELASLKNHGKVRLARFLLDLFDRMAQPSGGVMRLPHAFSHADIAAALGLTRRSVFDDITALEDFGAIDHSRDGYLVLCDRARLFRIANLAPSEDRDSAAAAWRADVAAALAANDTLRGFELSRESLLYHPRDVELRYLAALSALRAGLVDEAEALIAASNFTATAESERVAALMARVLKERAFAREAGTLLQEDACRAADLYHAVHSASGGTYSALNAASMYCVGSRMEKGLALARTLVRGTAPHGAGYWLYATRAEAFWLLGDTKAAAAMLRRATAAPDSDDGKIATTRRQLQRLAMYVGRDMAELAQAFPPRQIIVCTTPAQFGTLAAMPVLYRAGTILVIADAADLAAWATLQWPQAVELVFAAPVETAPRPAPEGGMRSLAGQVCHVADRSPEPGVASPARLIHAWRQALGLAFLAAAEHRAGVTLLDADEDRRDGHFPPWAAPDALAAGQSVVLWLRAPDETNTVAIAPAMAAVARAVAAGMVILRFAGIGEALAAASLLRARARAAGLELRLCLDIENLGVTRLEEALLPRLQPAVRPGEIFASQAAAAELALLRRDDLMLIAVGRVRSQRRLNRMQAWMVRLAAAGT